MKNHILFALVLSLFAVSDSFGQVYENIYAHAGAEVQNKIDNNKIAGIDILEGVLATHVIGISGLGISNVNALKDILLANSSVLSAEISEDGTIVHLVSKAIFTKENFSEEIQLFNSIITGYTAEYSINEQ